MTDDGMSVIQCFGCAEAEPKPIVVAGCAKCEWTGKLYWASGRAFAYTSRGKIMARAHTEREKAAPGKTPPSSSPLARSRFF